MISADYIFALAATVGGLVAFYLGRRFNILAALAVYFLAYELMPLWLELIGQYKRVPYLGFAIAIDWIAIYYIVGRSTVCFWTLCLSLFIGCFTFFDVLAGNSYFYVEGYDGVMQAISVLLLIGGAADAGITRSTSTDHGQYNSH